MVPRHTWSHATARKTFISILANVIILAACIPLSAATPPVQISPTAASVRAGATRTFSSVLTGVPGPVTYSVVGGNAFGTITSTGVYTAPLTNPGSAIKVRASVSVSSTAAGTPPSTTNTATTVTLTSDATVTWLNAAPVITSLSPPAVNVGTFTVTINGTGFLATSKVMLNGAAIPATFVSSTALKFQTTIATASSVVVTVANPDPGAATSSGRTLTIMPPASMTVSPLTSTVRLGATRKFYAGVENATDRTVSWSAVSGSVAADGTYTAPATMPASGTDTVTAKSNEFSSMTATATVTLDNPIPVISSISPSPLVYGTQTITVTGTGFVPTSVLKQADTVLTAQFVSSTSLTASVTLAPVPGNTVTFTVANPAPGPATSNIFIVPVGVANPQMSYLGAGRLLEQATWGPDAPSLVHLQQIGAEAWLTEQHNLPPTLLPTSNSSSNDLTAQQSLFFVNALRGQDQLRQRVAFALSQIFVVSGLKTGEPRQMVPFLNMLSQDAFGTYRNLLKDVTLSPTMGVYLDMVNNDKANPTQGTAPNENYAREVMQLFTIGTAKLNTDGSAQTDSMGNPLPSYTQSDISNLARALTGWTFPGTARTSGHNGENYNGPMIPVAVNHDTSSKTFLNHTTAQGQSAQQDLDEVLDVLSTHPNTALFISLRLIQHLVESNPSPAYLQRVANVFTTSGGDLWQVTHAILTDQEARQGDLTTDQPRPTGGHLREPILYTTTMLRTLEANVKNSNPIESLVADMGQYIYYSPSVFNYYSPLYKTANVLGGPPIYAPEFQLLSSATALVRANVVQNLLTQNLDGDVSYNLGPFTALTGSPTSLVDALDTAFMYGRMPASLKADIVTAIGQASARIDKVRNAIYLIASSSLYQVQH
jgi:uncharacterized protein (DUF1800 family)